MSQRAQRRVMKSAAMTTPPVVDGTSARVTRPEPVPASELPVGDLKQRVTLSLVPRINETNKRSVVITSIALVLLFVGVIVTLVLMNTSVAQRQYDIVSLRNQERALSQENQALLKEAESLSAPQTLAKKAAELGLVSPGANGLIDLSTGEITQEAEAAVESDENATDYATLPLPGEAINGAVTSESTTEQSATKESTTQAEKNTGAVSNDSTAAKEDSAQPAASDTETNAEVGNGNATREVGEDGRPVFTESELNGGTIPAPSTKSATD